MEYDATHKASSITSTTSTISTVSTSSTNTWDAILPTPETKDEEYPYDTIGFSPIYLQHGDQITAPTTFRRKASAPITANNYQPIRPSPVQRHRSLTSVLPVKKINRDLLSDNEKRINHIASEQKRRNTIRLGFKDLTDIIPTLKNINNSKSTILFKAVDYMKHLDRRNRTLLEKLSALQARSRAHAHTMQQKKARSSNSQRYKQVFGVQHQQHHHQQPQQELPAHTINALIAHKDQQRQLQELQDQLRVQQQLLKKHNIIPSSNASQYNSISIPSSASSHSDEHESQLYTHSTKRPWHTL
ncbi:hypothetical protein INT47_001781 [Mucor saturninus]|uniref:BHLH domain-containing protein n=1 Tax=Mucor saturninus TaxID=64648 RepID=A0A8H7QUI9_9FUNG|nr:hypothetical protein INT47_001781 [Mucor saturninus]